MGQAGGLVLCAVQGGVLTHQHWATLRGRDLDPHAPSPHPFPDPSGYVSVGCVSVPHLPSTPLGWRVERTVGLPTCGPASPQGGVCYTAWHFNRSDKAEDWEGWAS